MRVRARVYFLFIAYLFPTIVTVTGMVDIALVCHDFFSLSSLGCYQNANRRACVCASSPLRLPSVRRAHTLLMLLLLHTEICAQESRTQQDKRSAKFRSI